MSKEKMRLVTPFGEAMFCYLDRQEKYEGSEVGWTAKILLDKSDKEVKEMMKAMVDFVKEVGMDPKKVVFPFKDDTKNDGKILLRSRTKIEKPVVVDSKGNPFDAGKNQVGNGSIIRLNLQLKPQKVSGRQMLTSYLNGVQVKELVAPSSGFDSVEGGFVTSETSGENEDADSGFSFD